MSINKEYEISKITKQDIILELDSWGLNGKNILRQILKDFRKIEEHAKNVAKEEIFEDAQSTINKIVERIGKAKKILLV